ncbi:hypothetical protein [Amycolatopsis panacis]|uniref:GerMN domain-containing protein n=1 Tax=Amycolatopsis panacis TaxID=2340917 RepID=A0A419HRZ1_9PSEU|nr:hypothetical protein [Amycolatopsis panacis]RJQ79316.1 hypothetical protein D5S19_26535 [Amycolatopsis panacis]
MNRATAIVLALAGAVTGLSATACGVQPTDVIPAGDAPAAYDSGHGSTQLTLYFRFDGQLAPVTRDQSDVVTPSGALTALFRGPDAAESAQGYYSALPVNAAPASVNTAANPVVVTLPYPMKVIPSSGLNQIACTTVAALSAAGDSPGTDGVRVVSTDGSTTITCGTS